MANITTTQLNDSIPTIIAADVLGYLKANTVLARLVRRDFADETAIKGQTVQVPVAGTLSANDKAEGSAVQLQNPADDKVTVTLNKHKEVSFLIEDFARALAVPNWLDVYTAQGMAVLAEQIDGDIAALYSGLSQTIDATGGNGPLDAADFREARRLLNAAKAPLADRFAVLHEDAEADYLAVEEAINVNYARALGGALADAYTGRFYGFQTFMNQKIAVAAAVCKNLFFQRNALALVTRPLPPAPQGSGVLQRVMSEDGVGIRVTLSYDPDLLGVKVTIDVLYGVAELRDSHGIVISTTEK